MFVSLSTPPSPKIEGRGRGGGNFKSALSPFFMVGLSWGRGGGNFKSALSSLFMVGLARGKRQICLSPSQLPPLPKLGGKEGGKEILNQLYLHSLWLD